MPAQYNSQRYKIVVLALTWGLMAFAAITKAQTITNLHQLSRMLDAHQEIIGDVDMEVVVCSASRPEVGVLAVEDQTGAELLELGNLEREISPGERIHIQQISCLIRKREMGIQISAQPVVNNGGSNSRKVVSGKVTLSAGKIPLRLERFNQGDLSDLQVSWSNSNESSQPIEAANLWHTTITLTGETNFLPGLDAECFENFGETIPDFNLFQPFKTAETTNFDLDFSPHRKKVGIRYSGYLEVAHAGQYQFTVSSEDKTLLFLNKPDVPVITLGFTNPPVPAASELERTSLGNAGGFWTVIEGRVSFVSRIGNGVTFDLKTDQHIISAGLADASELDLSNLPNARVRITGVGQDVMALNQTLVLGKLFAASAQDIIFIDRPTRQAEPTLPIISAAQVQSLPVERARQSLPVHIHGIVTGTSKNGGQHWMSFQDDTHGIFVSLNAISNAVPAFGELWDVDGHSAAGGFAPIVVAEKITRMGEGLLPAPVIPTWTELLNGSQDVQWAELKGLVTDVQSNTISLYLPEGRLDVELEGVFESDFKQFLKANVRIRGVLYAAWDATTHEVRVGKVLMRNATISVDVPAPSDPFDAVLRTPRGLLLFDAQASAFRPVKVRGQITYADATQLFLEKNGSGLRLLPVEKPDVKPGDMVEAVGYPDIGESQLLLRDALLRKIGESPLPPPKKLEMSALSEGSMNLTRVRVEGKLLGWHIEQNNPVLEMQLGNRLYLVRTARIEPGLINLRPGSRLALEGVYIGGGHNQKSKTDNESFELLLNSLADITILSQPSWWTLPRLLALVGVLLVILILTVIWNNQLRRVVGQRTNLLQHEIRERERIEHQRALEAERSRIARDLHDDLGSSLTEISVLASTGQLKQTHTDHQPNLFQTIGIKARSLISALDVIVWAVDPEDNSLQSLADYLSGYADEFFSHTKIACRFKVPVSFPSVTLEGRVRHELLMAVKEALNNILRHAGATEVEFRMAMTDHNLEIDIADNGKGIEEEAASDGHGLKNLSTRLQKLGGNCKVESGADGGTIVRFRLPLTATENTIPTK